MGVSDHSFLEFWDTDDANNYPYYAGILNNDKSTRFSKSFYKSVKAGLTEDEVKAWRDSELQGSYRDGTCRESRKILKLGDGSYAKIPVIVGPTTEINGDIKFYLDRIASTASVPSFSYQDASYEGYWALASNGHVPEKKSKIKSSGDDPSLFDMMYDTCEDMPTELYDMCRQKVNESVISRNEFVSSNKTSSRRRLMSRRLDTPERACESNAYSPPVSYPLCIITAVRQAHAHLEIDTHADAHAHSLHT